MYERQDRVAALRNARRAALADALAQARRQADEVGRPLGMLRAIAENPTTCEAFGPNCSETARSTSSGPGALPAIPHGSLRDTLRVETTAVWRLGPGGAPGSLEIGGVGIAVAARTALRGSFDVRYDSHRKEVATRRAAAAIPRMRAALLAGGAELRDITTRTSLPDRYYGRWRVVRHIEARLRDADPAGDAPAHGGVEPEVIPGRWPIEPPGSRPTPGGVKPGAARTARSARRIPWKQSRL